MKLQQHYFRESTRPPDRHMRVWGLLAIMTWLPNPAFPVEAITVVSYGGSYAQASVEAYHKPFTEATGIEVRLDDFNGGLAQIRAQVDAGAVHWDVVDLATSHVELACNEGIIEIVDLDALAPGVNGEPPTTDFPEDARTECGPGFLYYSTIYAYNTNYIEGSPPETMEDFFDLEKFPGRRGMRREPFANLEFALLADGVPADQIYTVLDAPQGVDRALRKLDTIQGSCRLVGSWRATPADARRRRSPDVHGLERTYLQCPDNWKTSPSSSCGMANCLILGAKWRWLPARPALKRPWLLCDLSVVLNRLPISASTFPTARREVRPSP